MVTAVRPRRLPGVALLGLLTAILAHTAAYGNNHTLGGSYHMALELLALVGTGTLAMAVAALAALGARHADGSVLAAALARLCPGLVELAASGAVWFAAIETLEPEHPMKAPLALIVLALAVSAFLVSLATRSFVQAIAALALAIVTQRFVRRPVTYRRRFTRPSSARRTAFINRRYIRPPPITVTL